MSAALNVLEAQAQFDGPERHVSVRIAEHDGLIYLDLADEFWRCVEIGPGGWRIADDVPVRFRRPADAVFAGSLGGKCDRVAVALPVGPTGKIGYFDWQTGEQLERLARQLRETSARSASGRLFPLPCSCEHWISA